MLAITLGPVALPLPPLVLLAAVVAAQLLATRLARRPVRANDGAGHGIDANADTNADTNADANADASADANAVANADASARAVRSAQAADAVTTAALLGLLAARGAYLALHAAAYADAPWSVFDVRDGGWHAGAGLAAGFAWLAWRGLRTPPLRQALAAGATVGALVWFGLTSALGPRAGAELPGLTVVDHANGAALTLPQAAQGRPAVVVLWASWCGPCREEMPLLAAAQQREAGVRFLFVNQGEDEATVRRYLASLPYTVQNVLRDEPSALGPAVGSPGLPTTVFYDARGRQVDAHFGVLNAAALQSRLWPLRVGPVAPPQ